MHEKQPRFFFEHVTVKGCHVNVVFLQSRDHRVHFVRGEHEIAGRSDLSRSGFLKIDRLSNALRRSSDPGEPERGALAGET